MSCKSDNISVSANKDKNQITPQTMSCKSHNTSVSVNKTENQKTIEALQYKCVYKQR